MAIEKEVEYPADIPSWLMTFSDVITLLMTFFILLLTFATSEPETFDRMQVSLFGGGGATGIAGKRKSTVDQDSLLIRERSKAGRITTRGSEMPPIHSDPAYESVNEGLAALANDEERELSTQHFTLIAISLLIDSQSQITTVGTQYLRMVGQQLRKQALDVEFLVNDSEHLASAVQLVGHLYENEGVLPGKLSVGVDSGIGNDTLVKIVLTHPIMSSTDGTQKTTR